MDVWRQGGRLSLSEFRLFSSESNLMSNEDRPDLYTQPLELGGLVGDVLLLC